MIMEIWSFEIDPIISLLIIMRTKENTSMNSRKPIRLVFLSIVYVTVFLPSDNCIFILQ